MTQDLTTLTGVVGICGSAGALDAVQDFVGALPADSGLAVIVVIHRLSHPDSHLTSILQNRTELPVSKARDGVALGPNQVYIVPPDKTVTVEGSSLKVREPDSRESQKRPSDALLHSLAVAMGERAVAIILSGMGSDGSLGLRKLKEEGCLLYTSPSPRDRTRSRMPSSA